MSCAAWPGRPQATCEIVAGQVLLALGLGFGAAGAFASRGIGGDTASPCRLSSLRVAEVKVVA